MFIWKGWQCSFPSSAGTNTVWLNTGYPGVQQAFMFVPLMLNFSIFWMVIQLFFYNPRYFPSWRLKWEILKQSVCPPIFKMLQSTFLTVSKPCGLFSNSSFTNKHCCKDNWHELLGTLDYDEDVFHCWGQSTPDDMGASRLLETWEIGS